MVKELENQGERGVRPIRTISSFALKYHWKCSEKTIATVRSRHDNQGRRQEMGHLGPRTGLTPRQGGTGMKRDQSSGETLLTPAEVAALFRVDPKTVTRWAKAGKLSSIRTLGGHRRYRESEVMSLLEGVAPQRRS
jgi:excisionase family DNA binding protein